jgi:hypothetical protein
VTINNDILAAAGVLEPVGLEMPSPHLPLMLRTASSISLVMMS